MLEKFLLIRSVPLTCLISVSKRYIRTIPPVTPTGVSSSPSDKEDKTAIDSTGKVFTFHHGYKFIRNCHFDSKTLL